MLDSNALRDFHPFFILQQKARKCLIKRWTWTLLMLNETVGRKKCYIIPAPATTQFWGQIKYIVHIPKFFFSDSAVETSCEAVRHKMYGAINIMHLYTVLWSTVLQIVLEKLRNLRLSPDEIYNYTRNSACNLK